MEKRLWGNDVEKRITFKAGLEKGVQAFPEPSRLEAKPGECNYFRTQENFRNCGLATALFEECFQDKDVTKNGGVDPNVNEYFQDHPDERDAAKKRCAIIVSSTAPCPLT